MLLSCCAVIIHYRNKLLLRSKRSLLTAAPAEVTVVSFQVAQEAKQRTAVLLEPAADPSRFAVRLHVFCRYPPCSSPSQCDSASLSDSGPLADLVFLCHPHGVTTPLLHGLGRTSSHLLFVTCASHGQAGMESSSPPASLMLQTCTEWQILPGTRLCQWTNLLVPKGGGHR